MKFNVGQVYYILLNKCSGVIWGSIYVTSFTWLCLCESVSFLYIKQLRSSCFDVPITELHAPIHPKSDQSETPIWAQTDPPPLLEAHWGGGGNTAANTCQIRYFKIYFLKDIIQKVFYCKLNRFFAIRVQSFQL